MILGQGAECPICRTKISGFMQVFVSEPFDKERLHSAEERAAQAEEIQRQLQEEKCRLEERLAQAEELQRQSQEEKCRLEEELAKARAAQQTSESASVGVLDARIEALTDTVQVHIDMARALVASGADAGGDDVEMHGRLESTGESVATQSTARSHKRCREDGEELDTGEEPWRKCQIAWLEQASMVISVDD